MKMVYVIAGRYLSASVVRRYFKSSRNPNSPPAPSPLLKVEPPSGLDCSGEIQSRAGYPSKRAGSRCGLCTAGGPKGQGTGMPKRPPACRQTAGGLIRIPPRLLRPNSQPADGRDRCPRRWQGVDPSSERAHLLTHIYPLIGHRRFGNGAGNRGVASDLLRGCGGRILYSAPDTRLRSGNPGAARRLHP